MSRSLLIMFDTLLLRPSLHCNTPLHFTTLHPTTLHHTSPNYTSPHFTTLHPTTLHHPSPNYTSPHFTTLHHTSPPFTQLHFTTLHHPSPYYTSLHFTTLHHTITTLYQKGSLARSKSNFTKFASLSTRTTLAARHFFAQLWIPRCLLQLPLTIAIAIFRFQNAT